MLMKMKKSVLLLLAVVAGLSFTVRADAYRIKVGEFNELYVTNGINVVYSNNTDSVGYAYFDTKPEYANLVIIQYEKDKLRVQLAPEADGLKGLPTVRVYSTYLTRVDNTSDSTVVVHGAKPSAKFTAQLQGNGRLVADSLEANVLELKLITGRGQIVASGKCNNLTVQNVGTGEIQADAVDAANVTCKIMGTGTVGVSTSGKLNVSDMGTGKVYYRGKPSQVTVSKLGRIKAIALDETEPTAETVAEPVLQNGAERIDGDDDGEAGDAEYDEI